MASNNDDNEQKGGIVLTPKKLYISVVKISNELFKWHVPTIHDVGFRDPNECDEPLIVEDKKQQ